VRDDEPLNAQPFLQPTTTVRLTNIPKLGETSEFKRLTEMIEFL